jgi:lipoate-protein ligase A
VLRFWEPADYAVILGASCRMQEDVFVDACLTDGVPILRRSSGGGTVLIGPGGLNVTAVVSQSAAPGLSAVDVAHDYVMERIAAALQRSGAAVTIAGRGDLVVDGRKCGGSAQRRLKYWFMVHCSLLYQFALERIGRYLAIPERQPTYRAGRPHHDFLSNLGLPRKILVDSIASTWSADSCFSAARALPLSEARSLASEKFANPFWIERF